MIVKPALDAFAASDEKKWGADRDQTVGASEIGSCARMIFWRKNAGDDFFGADEDEDFVDGWGHKVRGNVFEEWWHVGMKRTYKDRFILSGPNQRTFRDGYLTATPDGYLFNLTPEEKAAMGIPADYTGGVSIDCKSIDPRVVLHEPKENHVYQLQVQMGTLQAHGEPAHYALISYTEASDWSNVKEFVVKFDPEAYATAKKRAQLIMTALGPDELKPEGIMSGGRECKFCPYTGACAKLRNERVPEREYKSADLSPPDVELLANLAVEIDHRKADKELAERELGELQEELRKALATLNVRNFKTPDGRVSVSWSKVKGRRGWDNAAIRERLTQEIGEQSMGAYMTEGEPSDRLVVTVKG